MVACSALCPKRTHLHNALELVAKRGGQGALDAHLHGSAAGRARAAQQRGGGGWCVMAHEVGAG